MQGAANKKSVFGVLRTAIWKTRIWVTLKELQGRERVRGLQRQKFTGLVKVAW